MRVRSKAAVGMAAALGISAMSGVYAMAGSALSIDMTNNNDEAWANIAMVNDDTVQTGVNIRVSQSENADITGYLYRGGAVRVLYKDSEWTEVSSGDITGYVKNEYLVYGSEAKGLAEYYGTYGVKASWNDVNVFSSQSGEGRIVDTAGDGDTYRLVNRDGDWMTVQGAGGSVAYVPSEDVSVVMVLGGAVSVDGTQEDSSGAAAESFRGLDTVEETAGTYASAGDGAGQESAETAGTGESYSDSSYADDSSSYSDSSYADESASYSDTGYTDDGSSYSDSSYADDSASYSDSSYADDGTSYSDSSYADDGSSYSDTSYTDAGSSQDSSASSYTDSTSYTTSVSTTGSYDELASQASSLYQEYLTAQAAADAAVANGSGEQAIKDTAAAAVAAYGRYVTAQNAADAAQWGVSTDSSSASSGTDSYTDTTADTSSVTASTDTTTDTSASTQTQTTQSTSADTGSTSQASSSDLELMAALIYCEAGNQPYEGQVAVGAVVMNRVASGSFPNSIREVIYQDGQFTPAYSGALASALSSGAGSGYIGAASDALGGSDPTNGCLYFNNHQGSGLQIGGHWFF